MNRTRKYFSVLLISALVIGLFPFCVSAAEKNAPASIIETPSPTQISSAGQLEEIRDMSADYRLICDIDLSGRNFSPIGGGIPFTGTFDGSGYTISGLSQNAEGFGGLFGSIGSGAVIKNIHLEQINIQNSSNLGPVYIGALAGAAHNAVIADCTVSGGSLKGVNYTGGLVGFSYMSAFERCSADIDVISSAASGTAIRPFDYAGGLVGSMKYGTVKQCFASGKVAGKGQVGGLIGSFERISASDFVENSYTGGDVSGKQTDTSGTFAGLVIDFSDTLTSGSPALRFCYSSGSIAEAAENNAETGANETMADQTSTTGVLQTFIGAGSTAGTQSVYMLASSASDDPSARTPEEMMHQSTYSGWDFQTVWSIDESRGLPYLKWSGEPEDDGAVLVSNARELREALMDGSIANIRFTADIQMDQGVVIQPKRAGSQLVIDGGGYTLTENYTSAYDTSKNIRLTQKGSLEKITLQNMNIIGQNGYGTIYAANAVSGLVQEYINVNYKGPQLTYNRNGTAYYKDSIFIIDFAENGRYSGELAEVKHAVFGGNVSITKEMDTDGVADKILWITGSGGSVTVEAGAALTVINNSRGQSGPSGFVYADSRYPFTVKENASFHYRGYEQFMQNVYPAAVTIHDRSAVNINILADDRKGFAAHPVFTAESSMIIGEEASFIIKTDGNLSYAMLRANGGLTVKEGADFRLIAENSSTASPVAPILTMGGNAADFQNPKNLLIYNSNDGRHSYARAIGFATAGKIRIASDKVDIWNNAAVSLGPEILENPTSSWSSDNDNPFVIEGGVRSGTNGTYSSFTLEGYGKDDLTADTFNLVNVKILQVTGK